MSKLIIVKSMVGVILCICVLCNYTKAQPEDGHYQAPKHVVVPYVENTLYLPINIVTIEDVFAWRQNLVRLAFVVTVFGSSNALALWRPVPCEISDSHIDVDSGQSSSSD